MVTPSVAFWNKVSDFSIDLKWQSPAAGERRKHIPFSLLPEPPAAGLCMPAGRMFFVEHGVEQLVVFLLKIRLTLL
jgi:hypothetical protein